jgi:hypothetical protein
LFIFSVYFLDFLAEKLKKIKFILPILILALIILSMVVTPKAFVFTPRANYYLEPFTPQPNFKGAYEAIKDQGWNDELVIVSPFTQLDKVYLGRSDYWLAISLDGRKLDKSKLTAREYYNNALTIPDVKTLQEVINSRHGYIVVGDMALSKRLDQDVIDLIGRQKLIFNDPNGPSGRIWVFSF